MSLIYNDYTHQPTNTTLTDANRSLHTQFPIQHSERKLSLDHSYWTTAELSDNTVFTEVFWFLNGKMKKDEEGLNFTFSLQDYFILL